MGRHPLKIKGWNRDLVGLISHLIFDGTINKNGCVYTNRNLVLHFQIRKGMKKIYPFPFRQYESLPGVFKTAYHNVELGPFLKKKSEQLIKKITKMNSDYQKIFLRSFFDDEGSVYFIRKRREIHGYQHNNKILCTIKGLLKGLGINSRTELKYKEIVISRRENLAKFARHINFTEGVRINGRRSNSVWKKSLEKRKLLESVLNSYR